MPDQEYAEFMRQALSVMGTMQAFISNMNADKNERAERQETQERQKSLEHVTDHLWSNVPTDEYTLLVKLAVHFSNFTEYEGHPWAEKEKERAQGYWAEWKTIQDIRLRAVIELGDLTRIPLTEEELRQEY